MKQKPLITIVVPVYKVPETYLRKCLDSICAQTCMNFEALLIDDGSPDNCGAVCDEYAAAHDFMRVIHQQNGGLSVVRNVGIDEATGDWVCFVDGDDWIEAEAMQFADQFIHDYGDNSDILIWDEYYNIDDIQKSNCFIRDYEQGVQIYSGEGKIQLMDMFFPQIYAPFPKNYVDLGCVHARVYKKTFLVGKGIYNKPGLKRMQDNLFNLWAIESADQICYQCKRLYHYRFNSDAVTQKYSPLHADTMYFLYECMEDFIKQKHNEAEWYQRLYCRFIRIFGEMFKLDYANPGNHKSIREKLSDIQRHFEWDKFREVVDKFDSSKQIKRIRFIHHSLQHKRYIILLIYYALSIRLRKYYWMLKPH